MTRIFLLISLLFFVVSPACAQSYTIDELLQIAEKNSANIKAADYYALAQKHFAKQQRYWSNPVVSYNNIASIDTYSVTQTVPFFGKLQRRYDIQEAEFRILENRRGSTVLLVKAEVFTLLYQYQALLRKIDLAKKRIKRLNTVDKYLLNIALNSPTKKAQGAITKDRIKLIERDLINYENDAVQIWNRANVFLNLEAAPQKIIITWLEGTDYQGEEYFINQAIENNFDLREQKLLVQKFKSELAYSKIEQMPDVNLAISQQRYPANTINRSENGAGISFAIPLINRNQEKIESDRSKIKAQEYELEFRTNQLIKLISNDLNEYEISLKLAKKFPLKTIDHSLSLLESANGDFKKGILDFITYLELDSQEYQMIDTVIDTQVQLANSYASLMAKIGKFVVPQNEN